MQRDRRRGKSDVKSHKIANNVTVISYRIDLCQRNAAKARLIIMRSPGHCSAASHAVVWQTFRLSCVDIDWLISIVGVWIICKQKISTISSCSFLSLNDFIGSASGSWTRYLYIFYLHVPSSFFGLISFSWNQWMSETVEEIEIVEKYRSIDCLHLRAAALRQHQDGCSNWWTASVNVTAISLHEIPIAECRMWWWMAKDVDGNQVRLV